MPKEEQSDKIQPTRKLVQKELGRGKTLTYEYLRKLENFGLLNTHRIGREKIWEIDRGR